MDFGSPGALLRRPERFAVSAMSIVAEGVSMRSEGNRSVSGHCFPASRNRLYLGASGLALAFALGAAPALADGGDSHLIVGGIEYGGAGGTRRRL